DANGDGKTTGDVGLGGFTIFVDESGDGKFTAGEPSAVTAPDGTWSITGLGSAHLGKTVYEVQQSGYVQTLGNAGHGLAGTSQNQSGLDSATFKLSLHEALTILDANGDGKTTGDAGLGGFTIFVDESGDGKFTAGEPSAVTAPN